MAINPEVVLPGDTRANKPKINVTNLKSVFLNNGGGGGLATTGKGGSMVPSSKSSIAKVNPSKLLPLPDQGLQPQAQAQTSDLAERVQTNTIKISKLIDINRLHRENHQKDRVEFVKLTNVVQEISKSFQKDLDDRKDAKQKEKEELAKQKAKEAQEEAESELESKDTKDTGKAIGDKTKKFVNPFSGILQKLKSAVMAIGAGILANAAFKYLGDPANYETINKVFGFIQKHWKWVMGGLGAIAVIALAAPLVAIAGTIGSVIAAVAGIAVVLAKVALAIGAIVGIIMGAKAIFRWLRGGKEAAEARQANRAALDAAGIKRTRNKFGRKGFDVMRDGKKTFVKYENLTETEKEAVDKFNAEDQRIKDVTKDRNKASKERKKAIRTERLGSDEYAAIQAMPKGKEKRIALDNFKAETIRLQNESDKETAKEFGDKMNSESLISRKIGGDTMGRSIVGEDGPEIVDFRTPTSIKRAQTTQDILKDMSSGGGGVQIINQELPPITADIPAIKVGSTPATSIDAVNPINPFNGYMSLVPELLSIE